MEYRTLGRTGIEVSRIGFGGAPLGLQYYLTNEDRDTPAFREEAKAALRRAVDRGITYFDTAPGYGGGRSETLLGEALEPVRERVVLGTKFPFDYRRPFDGELMTEGVRESLGRLRAEHVDLLQLHGTSFDDQQGEQILSSPLGDWLVQVKRQGLCRAVGITAEVPSGALERLLHSGWFETLQMCYNLVYQSACDYQREPRGVIPFARSLGMGILTMRAPTSGLLQRLIGQVFPGLDEKALTRLAINYVLSTPEVDCAIVGMRRVAEVDANADLADDLASRLDLRGLHERYPWGHGG